MEPSLEWKVENGIAGMDKPLQALRELLLWPLHYANEATILGLKWPRGLLLHGPPGTGKTSLVTAIARECGAHMITLSAGSIHRAYAGESEKLLRDAFTEAILHASGGKPSIIFIDEIDALCPRRDSRRQQETRLVAQLLTLMDGHLSANLHELSQSHSCRVVVVAATNRVNAIDPALRRPGRFDQEIEISAPNYQDRLAILKLQARCLPMEATDLDIVASMCNGYVGADLAALCREATMAALRKALDNGKDEVEKIEMEDWERARLKVGPSLVRGAVAEVPKVLWEDIGGLHLVKRKLRQLVEWPICHADAFARLGLRPARGVLLHGPPGCSKTTLAKASTHAAQATFFSLSGAELYSMYVGEGEALLRETFRRARLAAPSIIFFDEVDAFAVRREGNGQDSKSSGGATVGEKLLSTLLTEIDGLELAQGVLVLAATNRPQAVDAALMRPGRFDTVLYVPPPDEEGRLEILRIHTRSMKLGAGVNLGEIARSTEYFTGAELAGMCREAAMFALRENLSADTVHMHHLMAAKNSTIPSLTPSQLSTYAAFGSNIAPSGL